MPDDGPSRFPFQPNNAVDPRFFVGRRGLVMRVRRHAESALANSNVRVVYLSGSRGIGKTSLARYSRITLESLLDIWGFHIYLAGGGTPKTLDELMARTIRGLLEAKSFEAVRMKRIQQIFSHLILEVKLGVVNLKQKELAAATPKDASQLISFFAEFGSELYEKHHRGFVLTFDEIDEVALQPFFADFLKELVDAGAVANRRSPLLVLLCGTRGRFEAIRGNNERAGQQMDIIELPLLDRNEIREFFTRAFDATGRSVQADGLDVLINFSSGLPSIMHLVGEATLLKAPKDRPIDSQMAYRCAISAADDWGQKFADSRLPSLFQDTRLRRALEWLCDPQVTASFSRADLLANLGKKEEHRVDYLLRRLHEFKVLEQAGERGRWQFPNCLASLYLHVTGRRYLGDCVV